MKHIKTVEVSTKWFNESQPPPEKVLEILVDFMRRRAEPVYMGLIANEIGWSLGQTQEMLRELARRHVVRELSDDEKRIAGFPVGSNLWIIIK